MIASLAVTLFVEAVVVTGYALWRKKPLTQLLLSSSLANLFTQSFLWMILNLFPSQYLASLLLAEVWIWGIESLILISYWPNHLRPPEAVLLSLAMNMASFGLGWLLPV